MPKSGFGSDYKTKDPFDYPRLKLAVGEKARVCILGEPDYEYLHTLEAVITENGAPKMKKESLPGGREIEKPATDFRGQFVCLGDVDVLTKKGVDPDRCPACKATVENGSAVRKPERRYIVHVLKYTTKKNTFQATAPFSVEVLAWAFNDRRHSTLSDIADEHGDISRIDLLLGPAQPPERFQKYDVMPGGQAEWTKSDENKKLALETLRNNKSEDLSRLLGRKVDYTELRSAVQDVVNIYNAAFGFGGQMPAKAEAELPQESASIDDELTRMLEDESSKSTPESEAPAGDNEGKEEPVDSKGTKVSDVEDLQSFIDSL